MSYEQETGMTLYVSDTVGKKTNVSYPFEAVIKTLADLEKAVSHDHVFAKYKDKRSKDGCIIKNYRNKKGFVISNCLTMDCDNALANPLKNDLPPEVWKTPEDVAAAFPDVNFYVVYSRNHMKSKNGKIARPKFHVYFPLRNPICDVKKYERLKKTVLKIFPAFDDNAIDGARFFFGVDNPKVEYFNGSVFIDEMLDIADFKMPSVIPIGSRNNTLLSVALRALKRFGADIAYNKFVEASNRCEQKLDASELSQIWGNALRFYHEKIETSSYILPEEFNKAPDTSEHAINSDDIKLALKELGINVKLDLITGKIDIEGMPLQYSKSNAPNILPTLLYDYFSRKNIRVAKQLIEDSLLLIEDENRFNPIEEMLKKISYDGQDRIKELCDILSLKPDDSLYLKKWLHQCVAMALNDEKEPYGADGVLVIQAPQGTGKTYFCRKIALKPDWFAEGISIDVDNKDSIIQATNKWIAELGELDSTLKREQSALKAFLTSTKDSYRMPYARVAIDKIRRTSFCATVNPEEFLNDDTGSRRFWVIQPNIDIERLKALDKNWIIQLWLQVYHNLYLVNPQGFRLTVEERENLQKSNEKFSKPLLGEIEIKDFYDWNVPVKYWKWKKISEILSDIDVKNLIPAQIGRAMNKLISQDSRIKIKTPGNVRHYLLPPNP